MNYELVKQLKDAGFPQDWSRFEDHDPELLIKNWDMYSKGYSPTLSELIEACGDEFKGILRNVVPGIIGERWIVSNMDENLFTTSSTPEEAVAKLWLVINKHD